MCSVTHGLFPQATNQMGMQVKDPAASNAKCLQAVTWLVVHGNTRRRRHKDVK